MARSAASRAIVRPLFSALHSNGRRPIHKSLVQLSSIPSTLRRSFTSSPRWRLYTTELSEKDLAQLKASEGRLMSDIHFTSQWGMGERWGDGETDIGMRRLALSPDDRTARDWFVEATKALGCNVTIDEMGNIFAVRPGRRGNDVPATFVGSHLDTQPSGGRYDGILGVCAGVEMLRILNDHWIETEGGVGVVNWTNEEGARFPMSMMASGVWAGSIPLEKAHNNASVIPIPGQPEPQTVKSALSSIGYLGSVRASHYAMPMGGHFELHIEQGPHLVSSGQRIGIVEGVQAYRWHTITIQGRDAHTGTTSFEHRADAMQAAARIITASKDIARRHGCLASTGILTLKPGSTNTVPGFVQFTLDMRSPSDSALIACESELKSVASDVVTPKTAADGLPCSVTWTLDFDSPATKFHPTCISCVEDAAFAALADDPDHSSSQLVRRMTSGAGHDSVFANKRCPTSMVFVPCRDGVSHHPAEYCKPEDCALGATVITGAVVRFDRERFKGDSAF